MKRALWSVIVVCLVAASGAGGTDVRSEPQPAALARAAAPLAHTAAIHAASHAATQRARAAERHLPPAVLAAAVSLRTPALCALTGSRAVRDRAAPRLIATGSARGPPIA